MGVACAHQPHDASGHGRQCLFQQIHVGASLCHEIAANPYFDSYDSRQHSPSLGCFRVHPMACCLETLHAAKLEIFLSQHRVCGITGVYVDLYGGALVERRPSLSICLFICVKRPDVITRLQFRIAIEVSQCGKVRKEATTFIQLFHNADDVDRRRNRWPIATADAR